MDQEQDLFGDSLQNKEAGPFCFYLIYSFSFLLPSILVRSCVRVSGADLLDTSANNNG